MSSRSARPSVSQLGEFRLIRHLRRRFGQTGRAVLRGIGDDAAVIRPSSGHALLLTTDLLAEGIHFDLRTATFEDIGYKAAVANLSDIAAMGGRPQYMLVAVAIPASRTSSDVDRLYRGMMRACRLHKVELVGGDTSASRHGLFLSITLTGFVQAGRVLTRDGARVGDLLYVTGTLGDSLAGLTLLESARNRRSAAGDRLNQRRRRYQSYLIDRHLRPTPRIKEGQLLAAHRLATAAIDLSDGLSGDLMHICEQSGVGAEIETSALPLSPACRAYAAASRLDPVRLALTDGEDYELLFSISSGSRAKLERLARRTGCHFSRIGTVRPKRAGVRLRRVNGSSKRLAIAGYQHFQDPRTIPHEAAWSR